MILLLTPRRLLLPLLLLVAINSHLARAYKRNQQQRLDLPTIPPPEEISSPW